MREVFISRLNKVVAFQHHPIRVEHIKELTPGTGRTGLLLLSSSVGGDDSEADDVEYYLGGCYGTYFKHIRLMAFSAYYH